MPNVNLAGKPAVFSVGSYYTKLNSVRRLRCRFSGIVGRCVRSLRLVSAVLLPRASQPHTARTPQLATTVPTGDNVSDGNSLLDSRLPDGGVMVWLAPVNESKAPRSSTSLSAASSAVENSDIQKMLLRRRSRGRVERDIALARFGVLLSWIGSFALVCSVLCTATFFTCAWTLCALGLTWSAARSVKALRRETSRSNIGYN